MKVQHIHGQLYVKQNMVLGCLPYIIEHMHNGIRLNQNLGKEILSIRYGLLKQSQGHSCNINDQWAAAGRWGHRCRYIDIKFEMKIYKQLTLIFEFEESVHKKSSDID